MTTTLRSNTVSSFTVIKGSLVPETYAALRHWDLSESAERNFQMLRDTNAVGARSANWLRDVVRAIRRRLDPSGRDRSLTVLARNGCPIDVWKPILLWHMTRDEFLLRDFLVNWLFVRFQQQTHRLRSDDVLPYLASLSSRGVDVAGSWSTNTARRVAAGLLRIAADFGLLKGSVTREFAAYQLPESSFLYLLHAMMDDWQSAGKVVDSPDWQMFFMSRRDVENELLRLHQFRKVHYDAAGSLMQLKLPCGSAREYAERLVA